MCTTLLSFQISSTYPFVLLHNRDEYLNRPYKPAKYWDNFPTLWGGEDLQSHGMWLGTWGSEKFCSITNYRDPKSLKKDAPSRGFLVKSFLTGNLTPTEFIESIQTVLPSLNFFNLLLGTFKDPWYYSSRLNQLQRLTPGIYGLSNAELDSSWPKVIRGKNLLKEALLSSTQRTQMLFEACIEILEDRTQAADQELPSTGISLGTEQALSSIFVPTFNRPDLDDAYGTLTSSVVLLDSQGNLFHQEKIQQKL